MHPAETQIANGSQDGQRDRDRRHQKAPCPNQIECRLNCLVTQNRGNRYGAGRQRPKPVQLVSIIADGDRFTPVGEDF